MAVINGTAVNFGFVGTNGMTITGPTGTGTLVQSTEHSSNADVESARNGIGDIVTRGWYDIHEEATLEWIITGASVAAAQTNTTLGGITAGAFVTISACTSEPGLVATW